MKTGATEAFAQSDELLSESIEATKVFERTEAIYAETFFQESLGPRLCWVNTYETIWIKPEQRYSHQLQYHTKIPPELVNIIRSI